MIEVTVHVCVKECQWKLTCM